HHGSRSRRQAADHRRPIRRDQGAVGWLLSGRRARPRRGHRHRGQDPRRAPRIDRSSSDHDILVVVPEQIDSLYRAEWGRLLRAKGKIRGAAIPYRVPSAEELPARMDGVMAVIYLVFNEGYAATAGDALVRHELCAEAIRLARLLRALLPAPSAELDALLALMLLIDARRAARVDAGGGLVLL